MTKQYWSLVVPAACYDLTGVDVAEYRRRAAAKLARILAIATEP
jgi:hypothetical protein